MRPGFRIVMAVCTSYPELNVILAHLEAFECGMRYNKYLLPASRNILFDTSYISFYASEAALESMIRDIGVERVLFGSDYPWEYPGRAARIIDSLELNNGEREAVLWRNAAKLLENGKSLKQELSVNDLRVHI